MARAGTSFTVTGSWQAIFDTSLDGGTAARGVTITNGSTPIRVRITGVHDITGGLAYTVLGANATIERYSFNNLGGRITKIEVLENSGGGGGTVASWDVLVAGPQ